jgi:hypothetical protein
MDADSPSANYYAYEFWTTAAWGKNFDQMALRLRGACERATCRVFPELKRISRSRRPPTQCAAAIMLPAQVEGGVAHVHGFIRIPNLAAACEQRRMIVDEHGTIAEIVAPDNAS